MMKQICDFCDSVINDTDERCPHCGAPNAHVMRSANGIPKTIAELKSYAAANNLPLRQMRFFIGENFKEPRAFGIYEENGIFTVYKNKADGSRAIRYQGKDEAYAVNELYQKMHSEIMLQKQHIAQRGASQRKPPAKKSKAWIGIAAGFIAFILFCIFLGSIASNAPKKGYYSYGNDTYYYQSGNWYGYGDGGWTPVTPDSNLKSNYKDYYEGSSYQNGNDYSDFKDSGYYHESNDNDDWGSNDNWDSGDSWDSGISDWDSDW